MSLKKVLSVLLVGIMASLPLMACSNSGADISSDDPATQADSTEPAITGMETASGEKKVIGIVSISPSEANNARFIVSVTEAAQALGWEVNMTDAHGSADEANSAMQNYATKGVDAIIDMVFPVTSLSTGLRAAQEAGIPVATWGGGMADGVVVTNGTGGLHAVPIVEMMIKDMEGKGALLALTYHTGEVARDREGVLDSQLVDAPNIAVTKNEVRIPGYLQDGQQYANAWLAAHPEGDGEPLAIWGSWDDPAMGAISSLKQMNRTDVLVYGQNGNADAIKAIQEGWMTATAWQNTEAEALKIVEVLAEVFDAGDSWEPIAAEVDPIVITKDNVEQFIADHPEAIENVS